ncbi:hypothetical protein BD311DRAFT_707914 [Dichomitus squalens]|uniref:Small ribosomal subunit protein mS38 n=1 Tax=Dichomitus squalens TaxID=114155 RepID=A0A4Q9N4X4_9APHY|nr:hypothetical protein BD311DRAFT_707914 [Dichomitus squalens]
MSVLAHLLRPAAGARRAYSVFSKPGGGGYFNSSRSPKVAPPSSKAKVDSSSSTNADTTSPSTKEDTPSMTAGSSPSGETMHAPSSYTYTTSSSFSPVHPRISSQDLKLHEFFSLHRPLLTISQPPSSLFESYSSVFPMHPTNPPPETASFSSMEGESMEASPEADADAARQLARAMVVNRIGASIAWEEALKRLGLDVTSGRAEEVSLAEAEFEMYMDSTKRKRRKKMKKHKLKKRRRLNRSQRVKIGR